MARPTLLGIGKHPSKPWEILGFPRGSLRTRDITYSVRTLLISIMEGKILPKTENRKPQTFWIVLLVGLCLWLLGASPALSQEMVESQGIGLKLIPRGVYLLGSPADEPGRYADEALPHRVTLEPFYIGIYAVTNVQYGRFLKATGHPPPLYWEDKNLNLPTQPVVGVTWDDAVAFCQWLTELTGASHRLPSEAQWETAARGGLTGQPYPWGAETPDSGGAYRANYHTGNPGATGFKLTAPVGSFPANGYGLFDMAGNVSQWCLDLYQALPTQGPFKNGDLRLLKGGSWVSRARDLRAAARQAAPPGYADGYIGFRVVRLMTRLK
jgi:formylglycine-generating enzyme required for sulfatase activity